MSIIYRNVLLVDGMLVNWKVGRGCWYSVNAALVYRQPIKVLLDNPDSVTVTHEAIETSSVEEVAAVFQDTSFFKQFKIHPDVLGSIILP